MPDKATVWELTWKARELTEAQLKVLSMIIDEFLKVQGGNCGTNGTKS